MFKKLIKFLLYFISFLVILIFLTILVVNILTEPSNERDWSIDQIVLPHTSENKNDPNLITVHNIRNFKYKSITDYTPAYYDSTFDLNELDKVWYIVEPFSGIPGSAHTFLSFEFVDRETLESQFLAVSVEIRKEKGEKYSPIKGLFNQYELTYVLGDERDLINLRANYRKDDIYLYPVKTNKENVRQVFLSIIEKVNELKENPEFYNTVTNTCTTNIISHVNEIVPRRIPFLDLRILFPANSDELAYNLGLFDIDQTKYQSFEDVRHDYHINDKALEYKDSENFSEKIRGRYRK